VSLFDPNRGRIPLPDLDDRKWQDIVDQATALIQQYAPQWTDQQPSDIGITLIELFAWIVEALIYRLNQVPEKNYIAFLNLLGITRDPPQPAHAFLTFSTMTPPYVMAAGKQAQTAGSEPGEPIVFETDAPLTVLPLNLQTVLLVDGSSNQYSDVSMAFARPPARGNTLMIGAGKWVQVCLGFDAVTSEQISLWVSFFTALQFSGSTTLPNPVAVNATTAAGNNTLHFAATPAWIVVGMVIADLTSPSVIPASTTVVSTTGTTVVMSNNATGAGVGAADNIIFSSALPSLEWMYSTAASEPEPASPPPLAQWPDIPGVDDGTNGLQSDGFVALTVPGDWVQQSPSAWHTVTPATASGKIDAPSWWIGLRITNKADSDLSISFESILFNSVSAHSALTIQNPEELGTSDGKAFQVFQLANGPLYQDLSSATLYGHLVVEVGALDNSGNFTGAPWGQVDDFPQGPGTCYRLDPIAAEISFGNFDSNNPSGYGSIPPAGSLIRARSYRYVDSGLSANVAGGTVIAMRSNVAGITSVINLADAKDGSDPKSIEDTKQLAPQLLRTKDRAVTKKDYELLAKQASTELKEAWCLGARYESETKAYNYGGLIRSAGSINVIILPNLKPDVSPTPQPTPDLVLQVQDYLDTKRDVTARVSVTGPKYLPINVQIAASVWPTAKVTTQDLKQYIQDRIRTYFHPVTGGLDGKGWQIGQSVFVGDLYQAIMPPQDWGYISNLQVQPGVPLYTPPQRPSDYLDPNTTPPSSWAACVQLADYELVCFVGDPVWQ
jgi:hypothetical protein